MQIRRADPLDEEVLRSIRRRAILALAGSTFSAQQVEQWASGAPADRVARAIREHDVWMAADGAVIAWVEVDGDRVAALYVLPSHSRRGVGSHLLLHAEAAIRSAGHPTARLEASPNALEFYLRRGYRRSGPDLPDGSHPVTKVLSPSSRQTQ